MLRKIILIILLFLQFGCGYKIANNSSYYEFQILSVKKDISENELLKMVNSNEKIKKLYH